MRSFHLLYMNISLVQPMRRYKLHLNEFREHLNNQTANLQSIVSDINSQDLNIDQGIGTFANVLYKSAFHAFGVTKHVNNNMCKRKQTSP